MTDREDLVRRLRECHAAAKSLEGMCVDDLSFNDLRATLAEAAYEIDKLVPRLITLDEVLSYKVPAVVYLERPNFHGVYPAIVLSRTRLQDLRLLTWLGEGWFSFMDYLKDWRLWTYPPTMEQAGKVPWDERTYGEE